MLSTIIIIICICILCIAIFIGVFDIKIKISYTKKTKTTFNLDEFKVGDRVTIISNPRSYDNADAFKNYTGTIEEIHDTWLIIKCETSILIISDFTNLKLQKIS